MITEPNMDQTKVEEFVGRVLADTSASMITTLCALGDRLGLFKDLAAAGPATSSELATRADVFRLNQNIPPAQ